MLCDHLNRIVFVCVEEILDRLTTSNSVVFVIVMCF